MKMTLGSILDVNAHNYPNREAFIFKETRSTYSELNSIVIKRANALLHLGVNKGDHIGTLFANCMEAVETILAIWKIGAVLIPLSFRISPNELSYIIEHSEISVVIFQDKFEETIKEIKPLVSNVKSFLFSGNTPLKEFIDFDSESNKQPNQMPKLEVEEDDIATILYTAGTTGKPKGVVATHANWVWACVNYLVALTKGKYQHDIGLTVFPLFHAAAIGNLLAGIYAGMTLIFLEKFDPIRILETIEQEKITRLGNPPTAYKMILRAPNIKKYDLSSVKFLQSGSEMMPDDTRNKLKEVFPEAGIVENYGMTETCGSISSRREVFTDSKPFSVGLPHPFMKVRVVDNQGRDVAAGEAGEIIVSGPNVMKEYYKNPEQTAKTIRDGWLHTEDIGRFDEDGFLYVIERKHHMIISGGENIYPKEVEEILYKHPKIIETAVFGLLDEIWGQKVCAAIVLTPGEQLSSEEVIEFCQEKIASFKKPKVVYFVKTLPKSPIGKILRSVLKKQFSEK